MKRYTLLFLLAVMIGVFSFYYCTQYETCKNITYKSVDKIISISTEFPKNNSKIIDNSEIRGAESIKFKIKNGIIMITINNAEQLIIPRECLISILK